MTVRHRPNDPAARPTIPESERENQFRVEGTSHAGDRSTAELVSDMSEQAARLLRIEARLAVREVLRKSKRGVAGGKFLAAAASLT
ncbi:MAG: phage holin family protein, partial [Stackebrandtia sp.]